MPPKKFPALLGNLSGGRLGCSLRPPSLGGKSPLVRLAKAVGRHRPRPTFSPLPTPTVSLLALLSPQPQFWLLEEDKRVGFLSLLPGLK